MTPWRDISIALIDWIATALDIDREQILWKNQNLPQPAYPFVTLHRDTILTEGFQDEVRNSTDLTQPIGKEVILETYGVRTFTLNVDIRLDEEAGSADPEKDAVFLLDKLQSSLRFPEALDVLCLAGVAIVENLPIVDLSAVVNSEILGRAAMDLRVRVTSVATENTGFIDTVNVKSECDPPTSSDVTGVDLTV